MHRRGFPPLIASLVVAAGLNAMGADLLQTTVENGSARRITLRDAVMAALLHNRDLQIERLGPDIARASFEESYGYYDPLLLLQGRHENTADSGGFDPADFSRDAIYDAESRVASLDLTGRLPGGATLLLGGGYANSFGLRNGLNFDSYKLAVAASLRQPLLRDFWIDAGRLLIRTGRSQVGISQLTLQQRTLDVLWTVEQAYIELAWAHESLRVHDELVDARSRTLAGTRRRYDQGLAPLPDVQLAESQLASAQASLFAARNTVALAANNLRLHLGGFADGVEPVPLEPAERLLLLPDPATPSDSLELAMIRRPDLRALRHEVELAGQNVRYRRNQLFPALDLVAGYGRRGASAMQLPPPLSPEASVDDALEQIRDAAAPNEVIGFTVTVPLGRFRERAAFRQAKSLREQSALRVKQREEWIAREIADAHHTVRLQFQRAGMARDAVDLARASVLAEQRRLEAGTGTLLFVLQLQAELVAVQSAEVRARADYNQAVARLRQADASLLDRWGIVFEDEHSTGD